MDSESARRLRRFAVAFTFIFGVSSLLLWYAVVAAASLRGWQITLNMPFGEGPLELLVMQLVLAITMLGMVGFHELMLASADDSNRAEQTGAHQEQETS